MIRNDYQYDFFSNEHLKTISTGIEVPEAVTQNMLSVAEIGHKCYKTYVTTRLVKQEKSMFDKITKNKLKTGIEKTPKTQKPVEALKEDAQGFGFWWLQKINSCQHQSI